MRAQLLRLADHLRESYWFVPTLMAFAAIVLAGGMIALDSYEGAAWMDRFAWLQASRPDGARQVLSSIGGSMITVAGTVFSVTIAAVVYASGQYGPRLLSNFMSDRGNQVTLGTFIATFLYCLLVLRTIRSPEESDAAGFVPNMALLVGVLLALCSLAVLIFFIHHVPSKLHINNVIEEVGDRLLHEINRRFPTFIGEGGDTGDRDAEVPIALRADATDDESADRAQFTASKTGYIQMIDNDTIMELASEHDLVLRLQYQPGDFVHAGRTLVEAWPPGRCDQDVSEAVQELFGIGAKRSALQDLRFLIDELVEIAARALSPGVNDPFTAITCLDWLGAALSELARRSLPSHLRLDEDGRLRVIAHPETFEGFLGQSLGSLMQYCARDVTTALRFIHVLAQISIDCDDPGRVAALGAYAAKLETLSRQALNDSNFEPIAERCGEFRRILAEPDYKRRLRDQAAWLGGLA
ncbi:DUF2254 domain-containing protein [Pleomorphomonas sp. NRK KF1]|uniref:DUF2254 domain-containing protein n=1 Tax=Pleomorphomonas sp. NRK KF1 TaxID=2943000 RepID=UPI002043217A|nr:DUF2254 domain-containing protein [Pleomorphomonas sp. NRK KF1]MCM5551834.1 DUF2254 domain-containing protein [Pleomorphomonas sp. NRK KF1]